MTDFQCLQEVQISTKFKIRVTPSVYPQKTSSVLATGRWIYIAHKYNTMLTPSDRLHLQQIQKQFADVGWINREDLIWLMDTLAQIIEMSE